jgi:hypothetical protein
MRRTIIKNAVVALLFASLLATAPGCTELVLRQVPGFTLGFWTGTVVAGLCPTVEVEQTCYRDGELIDCSEVVGD